MADRENVLDSEQKRIHDNDLPLSFIEDRHVETIEGMSQTLTQTWRMKERMKTVSVALVLCLNVGVDPPDVMKTQPCARLECWIDPLSLSSAKALESIGATLQKQYERWQPRARYKQSLDPTAEDVKKLCVSLRRNAKDERVLFHYNGHGVPKPTTNGEIWVFNRTYTQYIPMSVYDLQTWMGSPSIYVYDCSNAGMIVESFQQYAEQHENEYEQARAPGQIPPTFTNCIQLGACGKDQVLPMNPDQPADLFTSCLTTPLKVALRYWACQPTATLVPDVTLELIERIPGQTSDRRTMMGELNWIFTAITDTIAWNSLPRELFQKLFRQDLLVASLFRNFLLAERVMRSCDCNPVSSPRLPPTYQHSMWLAWDLVLDQSLGQLPRMLNHGKEYEHLSFFEDQLTAFEVWLRCGSETRKPPEQLPIVLQVLLSQVHRMRALELLGKFLDLGPWAVNLALSVGIFPYVLKLLQSCAKELRPLLVFIWAKILAVDNTCQADLVREGGHKYFLGVLLDSTANAEHRRQATFVLACIVNKHFEGQEVALQGSLVSTCLEQLSDPEPKLRMWVCICLGRLWENYEKARWTGVRDIAHEKLYTQLSDPVPEVRCAAVYALGTFINSVGKRTEHANNIDHNVLMTLLNTVLFDMSPMVREELIVALQWIVLEFEQSFVNGVMQETTTQETQHQLPTANIGMKRIASRDRMRLLSPSISHSSGIDHIDSAERLKRVASSSSISTIGNPFFSHMYSSGSLGTLSGLSFNSAHKKLWDALNGLENDPYPEVARMASTITTYVRNKAIEKAKQKESGDSRLCNSVPGSPNSRALATTSYNMAGESAAMRNLTLNPRRPFNMMEEESKVAKKPLVTTDFVDWCCKGFTIKSNKQHPLDDKFSQLFYERDWRRQRNAKIKSDALTEQARANTSKLDNQHVVLRTQNTPQLLIFHPYDQQVVAVTNDHFSLYDWGTAAKISSSPRCAKSTGRITSLDWVNSHDLSLVMTGSDDGTVRLWNAHERKETTTLVSAWQAHTDLAPFGKHTVSNGLLLTWEQYSQILITTGDTRVLRLWDANKELRLYDIPTGADCPASALDATYSDVDYMSNLYVPKYSNCEEVGFEMGEGGEGAATAAMSEASPPTPENKMGLVMTGHEDGSVRIFDRRCPPNEARIKTWMEHERRVLGVQLRGIKGYSASAKGDVIQYDMRTSKGLPVSNMMSPHEMCAFALHRRTNCYAAASSNQTIQVHNVSGLCLNVIRLPEGNSFMGYRMGSINTIAFHPHKASLAVGTSDGAISIYNLEHSKR